MVLVYAAKFCVLAETVMLVFFDMYDMEQQVLNLYSTLADCTEAKDNARAVTHTGFEMY
jgi:hypothetical protein